MVLQARRGAWWDANKVGLSPPLIETPRGWLMIYHGVRHTAAGCLYRLGLALLDLKRPDHCLLRGDMWVFGPEEAYEREGDVGNVAFPCGYTIGADNDTLFLYYGAADTSLALATGSIRQLLRWLDEHGSAVGVPEPLAARFRPGFPLDGEPNTLARLDGEPNTLPRPQTPATAGPAVG